MTIDEAKIKIEELACYARTKGWDDEYTEAVNMAIKALEPQYCGDCISREETLKALMDEWTDFDSELMDYLIEKVRKLPSVTPQQKVGYISIDDVMAVFDDFMRGDVDENNTETFLEMLKDKAEGSEE